MPTRREPTAKQLLFIDHLRRERGIPGDARQTIRMMVKTADPMNPSKDEASAAIEKLLQTPVKPNPKALEALEMLDNLGAPATTNAAAATDGPDYSMAFINDYINSHNDHSTAAGSTRPLSAILSTYIFPPDPDPDPNPNPTPSTFTPTGPPDPYFTSLITHQIETILQQKITSITDVEKQIVKAAGTFAENIALSVAQSVARDTTRKAVDQILSPEKLETLIKPIIEKSIRGTTESIILTLLSKGETTNPETRETTKQYDLETPKQYDLDLGDHTTTTTLPTRTPPTPSPTRTPSPNPPNNSNFYFDPNVSRAILTALSLQKNFYISGPTGCGKTKTIIKIHQNLERKHLRINMHGDVTMVSFLGGWEVKNHETVYHYGALPRAMKAGITLLCDEIDYTPPHIAAILNPVMEGERHLYLPETQETITAKDGFLIAATGNSGGKGDATGVYTGIEILNTAFLDRFPIKINMQYPPAVEEEKLLKAKFPATNENLICQLVSFANHVRQAFQRQELSATLSTRKLIDLLEMTTNGLGITEGLELTFLNWLDDDDKRLVETFADRLDLET